VNYNWRFNETLVGSFDEHVRKSVPLYDVFHKSILELSKYFIRPNTDIIDVGTSTGHFINSIYDDALLNDSEINVNNNKAVIGIYNRILKELKEK
jgi:hypothetical protein